MKVRELMTSNPAVCTPKDSCAAAGQIMARKNCGFVPIVENMETRRVVGVVTDRDLALHLAQAGLPANKISVEACMTKQPKVLSAEASLEEAVQLMEKATIHRLPVVENGRLVGVLSLKEIACLARREHSSQGLGPTERQVAEIVETIAVAR
ncbi:MAG: CBS domain-containing protein [Candidatus Omnitrophica bacterium]|nr:CBS domain-containing protein [Candidatus Omnitrophota bacterium]